MRSKRGASVVLAVLLFATGVLDGLAGAPAPASAQPAPESGSSDWRSVSVGSISACGIRTTGRLYCWGYGGYLGDGSDGSTDRPIPTEVAGGLTTWKSVSVDGETACAIHAPGRLFCWGNNFYGALGFPGTNFFLTPTEVTGGFTDWTAVSAGPNSTCARRSNGRLYCWGRDNEGQVGNGPVQGGGSTPRLVAGGFTNWTSVDVGGSFACGRRATGRLYCWGYNHSGQLGNGNQTDQQSPTLVQGGITDWTAVSTGSSHACGIRAAGQRLFCWGLGDEGQRGGGDKGQVQTTPLPISDLRWTQVAAGSAHTCGRRNTGRLFCWGRTIDGQLGIGSFGPVQAPTPVEVSGGATDWSSVSAGGRSSCARTRSGRLYCWGNDDFGQLGNGDEGTDDDPSEVFAP